MFSEGRIAVCPSSSAPRTSGTPSTTVRCKEVKDKGRPPGKSLSSLLQVPDRVLVPRISLLRSGKGRRRGTRVVRHFSRPSLHRGERRHHFAREAAQARPAAFAATGS